MLLKLRQPPARPEWLAHTRQQLVAYVATRPRLAARHAHSPWFGLATPLAASLGALVLVAVGATGAAAQQALPTDLLYPVKLVAEQAQLVFARPSPRRVTVQLQHADERLHEARQLAERGASAQLLTSTLSRYEAEIAGAVAIAVNEPSTAGPSVPGQVRERLVGQQQNLVRLGERVREHGVDKSLTSGGLPQQARLAVLQAIKSSSESELEVMGVGERQTEPNDKGNKNKALKQESSGSARLQGQVPGVEPAALSAPSQSLFDEAVSSDLAEEPEWEDEIEDEVDQAAVALAEEAGVKLAEAEAILATLEVEWSATASPRLNEALEQAQAAVLKASTALFEASAHGTLGAQRTAYREVLKAYQLALTAEIVSVNTAGSANDDDNDDERDDDSD